MKMKILLGLCLAFVVVSGADLRSSSQIRHHPRHTEKTPRILYGLYPRTLHYVNQDSSWVGQGSAHSSSGNQKTMAELQANKRDDAKTNLIINYLPQSMTEKELYSMFVTIGPVESCRVMKDFKTGYSYGFGFVNYANPEDASRAIGTLNGLQVQNKRLKVSFARPSGDEIKETNLYVTNLPRNITEQYLDTLFGKFGQIVQKNLLKDKVTGMPRGVAFVRYDKREEAQEAINNLNGIIPENGTEPLVVKIAEEHGKQKAAYYAGWQAGYNQSRGGGAGSARGGGSRGGIVSRGGGVVRGGGGSLYEGVRGAFTNGAYVMRSDKAHNRYNPIGMGGGYNMYNWN